MDLLERDTRQAPQATGLLDSDPALQEQAGEPRLEGARGSRRRSDGQPPCRDTTHHVVVPHPRLYPDRVRTRECTAVHLEGEDIGNAK